MGEFVFVSGVTLGLLITDSAGAPIRGTNDVDVIAVILTYPDYIVFSERLLQSGFTEDAGEKPLACRWRQGHLILDVLPLDEKVLGYTNRWYRSALASAQKVVLPIGLQILVITAPFFLGTKMEAFRGRGKNDFIESHDLEDFVAVIDGRSTIVEEIAQAPVDLQRYLAEAANAAGRHTLPGGFARLRLWRCSLAAACAAHRAEARRDFTHGIICPAPVETTAYSLVDKEIRKERKRSL